MLFALCKLRQVFVPFVLITIALVAYSTFHGDRLVRRVLYAIEKYKPPATTPILAPRVQGCSISESEDDAEIFNTPCAGASLPGDLLSQVQIVMKTGVAEKQKTEAFLETYGSCIPNILILSDAVYSVGGRNVTDILAELPKSYAEDNPDWTAYLEQQQVLARGGQPDKSDGGWRLDRFKFLPMVEKAFEQSPHAKWYVFIEADIYYFWDTLFRLLSTFDPERRHYFGSPAPGSYDRWFAYGGAGTVLSGRLVRDLLQDGRQKLSARPKYEDWIKKDCCGDAVLGYVIFEELNHRLEHLYPTFTGEVAQEIRITTDKWCTPLLGLHRVGPEEMRRLWRWERCRQYTESPITFATFLDFVLPKELGDGHKLQWDNGADLVLPPESTAHSSLEGCRLACTWDRDCLQYTYADSTCRVATFVMGGRHSSDERDVVSGWDLASLRKLGYAPDEDPGSYCARPKWMKPVLTGP